MLLCEKHHIQKSESLMTQKRSFLGCFFSGYFYVDSRLCYLCQTAQLGSSEQHMQYFVFRFVLFGRVNSKISSRPKITTKQQKSRLVMGTTNKKHFNYMKV